MAATFFETLNYSSVNEDWRTETAALSPGSGSAVSVAPQTGQSSPAWSPSVTA
jgi:S-adenosylmethionine:diacylglycerol 3-amino-3-carboxypropyl transferase